MLAAACGIVLGCNAASYSSTEHEFFAVRITPILTTISVMIALTIVICIILKQNPYRVLRKKEFVFAEEVSKEIMEEFFKMRKFLIVGIALGLIIFGVSNCGTGMEIVQGMNYMDILLYLAFSMIVTGISSFITFFCIGIYWSYSILLQGQERKERD